MNKLAEKKHLYDPVAATITNIEELTHLEKRFEIQLSDNKPLGHKPGQFVQVSIPGFGEAPISICSSPTSMPAFYLTVRKVGRLTNKLHLFEK